MYYVIYHRNDGCVQTGKGCSGMHTPKKGHTVVMKTGIKTSCKKQADLNTDLNIAYIATRTMGAFRWAKDIRECVQTVSASDTPSTEAA